MPLLPAEAPRWPGLLSIALGFTLALWAFLSMHRARTTFNVYRATTSIVTAGPYRWSRNPGYLGLAIAYLGFAWLADSLWVLSMAAPAILVLQFGVVRREERYLERKFGDEYRRYRARVRRWL